jgi:hypothetical protein
MIAKRSCLIPNKLAYGVVVLCCSGGLWPPAALKRIIAGEGRTTATNDN